MRAPRLWATTALILWVLVSFGAQPELCSVDEVPAATLLLPYFEVELDRHHDRYASPTPRWIGY